MKTADPTPVRPPTPFPVTPVNVTSFSAGNRWRHFIQPIMFEWWNWRARNNDQIFVMAPEDHRRIVHRRMSRVRRLDHLVANRRVTYDAPSYGADGTVSSAGLPNFSYRRKGR